MHHFVFFVGENGGQRAMGERKEKMERGNEARRVGVSDGGGRGRSAISSGLISDSRLISYINNVLEHTRIGHGTFSVGYQRTLARTHTTCSVGNSTCLVGHTTYIVDEPHMFHGF